VSSPSPPAPARSRADPVPLHPDADGFYRCARALVALAMRAFFRRTVVRGAENVPERGPLILAANHPNSIVDAFAIGLATPRKVHFLARSIAGSTPPNGWPATSRSSSAATSCSKPAA